jgi:polysaccharide export outer membrane protein
MCPIDVRRAARANILGPSISLGFAIALIAQGLTACRGVNIPESSVKKLTDVQAADPQLQQPHAPSYVIQPEDTVILSFPLTPELNQTVIVQPDGFISLPNGGSLYVAGSTVPNLVDALKKAYTGTLRDPIINVDLKDFQRPYFTVSGQVGRPGRYELRGDLTVPEAIAVAGGFAPTAKGQVFLFHRTSVSLYEVTSVQLKLDSTGTRELQSLRPGDMIFVPETFITKFRKYVPYSINAGAYFQQNPF